MNLKSILYGALSALTALTLSACSGSSGGGGGDTPNRQPKVQNFNTQSCAFSLQDGGAADVSLIDSSRIETAAFGKPFNSEFLLAVGKASIASTLAFIPKTNAIVYKTERVPTQQCSKDLFDSLSSPPSDLQGEWTKAAPEKEDSILMGLYIPKSQTPSAALPSVNDHAAIMLRTNTNRWTLVHEFMHHLFMLESVAEGFNSSGERQKYEDAVNGWNNIAKNKTMSLDQKIDAFGDLYIPLVTSIDTQLIHFPLEEVAVEIKMKEYVAAQKLSFVPASSNWYINGSADAARKAWSSIRDLGQNLLNATQTHPGHDTAAKNFQQMLNLIDARTQEINDTVSAYPMPPNSLNHDLSVTLGMEAHAGCSHQAQAEELLRTVRGLGLE